MDYLSWNDAISARFFDPDKDGQRVILVVSKETIEQIGEEHGIARLRAMSDFIAAMKLGPDWTRHHLWRQWPLCEQAFETFSTWRARKLASPPYIAYLALFVLAAGHQPTAPTAPHAYYPRLRDLLGMEREGRCPGFEHMWQLWEDLEKWSVQDKGGTLGFFQVNVAVAWVHVGRPLSQVLLSDHEREILPAIFARAALDPMIPVSDRILASAVHACAAGELHLHQRTMALLEQFQAGTVRPDSREAVLVAVLRDELQNWDSMVVMPSQIVPKSRSARATGSLPSSHEERRTHGAIRLCCEIDGVTDDATLRLRCSTSVPLPEDGLRLVSETPRVALTCSEAAPGWSSPLRYSDGGDFQIATTLRAGITARCGDRWVFVMPPADVRILASGAADGLPDYIEVRQLPTTGPFYLLAIEEARSTIEAWGARGCRGFARVPVMDGLPRGWTLYRVDAVLDDAGIKQRFPALALPATVQLRLAGGVGAGKPYQYLAVAPPSIVVDGAPDDAEVRCNGVPLTQGSVNGIIALPTSVPVGEPLVLEVKQGADGLARRTIYLVEGIAWPPEREGPWLDRFGEPVVDVMAGMPLIAGALVAGGAVLPFGDAWGDPSVGAIRERDLARIEGEMRVRRQPMTLFEICDLLR